MNSKNKLLFSLIIAFVLGMLVMYLFKTYTLEKRMPEPDSATVQTSATSREHNGSSTNQNTHQDRQQPASGDISELTKEEVVVAYIKEHHQLPDYYITKKEARAQGWVASEGNLCDVLPGKAIGGDRFSNREKKLPKGNQYFEADINYNCGRRTADRIVFTHEGEVWVTLDHYKSFQRQ